MEVSTRSLLDRMTDAGRFEALAASVLRAAVPALAALAETGTNPDGRPQSSPLDGIAFAPGSEPPHLVAVHHTTTASARLRGKWLGGLKATEEDPGSDNVGDLAKTMRVVREERARRSDLRATLVLTANRDPDEALVRDIHAAAADLGINVDLWPGSRIAHYLDLDPNGQEIRRIHFGKRQTRLSRGRLDELSRKGLDDLTPRADPQTWVDRKLDADIEASTERVMTFVVAASGSGKSVACRRSLARHVAGGHWGWIVGENAIAAASSLAVALDLTLCDLDHSLLNPAEEALEFASESSPLLLVVEDVNRSESPAALLTKLVDWTTDVNGNPIAVGRVRVLCPVWPEHVRALEDAAQKRVYTSSVIGSGFTNREGGNALKARAGRIGRTLTSSEARALSTGLGDDPLLIGLYDFDATPDPATVVGGWVARALVRAERSTMQAHLAVEYHAALLALARSMIARRRPVPTWSDLSQWSELQPDHVICLRSLVRHGELARVEGPPSAQRIAFRHDRVRDWLIIEAAADMLERDSLADDIVRDPWFARLMGELAARDHCPKSFVDGLAAANPLALMYALATLGGRSGPKRDEVLHAIERWMGDLETSARAHNQLRRSALQVLATADDPAVPSLANRLDRWGNAGGPALLRNGDVRGGIILCSFLEPGMGAPWRDIQMEHGLARHGPRLKRDLLCVLRNPELTEGDRRGAIRLAGHFADPALGPALFEIWARYPDHLSELTDYIWALARCCGDDPDGLLGPALDEWASLPEESKDGVHLSPRTKVAEHYLRLAFRAWPPVAALAYLAERAHDPRLGSLIAWIMHGVDHPKALTFVVRYYGAEDRRLEGTGKFRISFLHDDWRRKQGDGRLMSAASRAALRLIWEHESKDRFDQRVAFDLWAATRAIDDLAVLRGTVGSDLADKVLAARLERRDVEAVPQLLDRLNDEQRTKGFWWHKARHVPTDAVLARLEEALVCRSRDGDEDAKDDLSTWAADLLARVPIERAEAILVRGWGAVRRRPWLIQMALFHATPRLLEMVEAALPEFEGGTDPFEHIGFCFGFIMSDHPGMTREAQARALVPYLDRLSEQDLHGFWETVNRLGWFNFRRRHLDARLPAKYCGGSWRPSRFSVQLDEALTRGSHYMFNHEVRDLLKADTPWGEVRNLLAGWLRTHDEHGALRIASHILHQFGGRTDLSLLVGWPGRMDEEAADIIADVTFAVRLRSLV